MSLQEVEKVKIPKFRNPRRLVDWVKKNRGVFKGRLPEEREQVFFKSKTEPRTVATLVLQYYRYISSSIEGPLPEKFENLLRPNHSALLCYLRDIHSNGYNVDPSLLDELKGDSNHLLQWASYTETRLPKHLEDSIDDPDCMLRYSTDVLCGRLPEHLEKVFFKDAEAASQYAFQVIRGFAPIKLPDDLHTFMVMKSFEEPDNRYIKQYMEASEDDPNKTGNHASS